MADKLLKSIKFPTLPDRYVIGDSTLTEEGAAAEAKAVGEALATKADTKGTYEDLIVGGAEQLMADGYETDTEPYLFRTTGGSADVGNREYLDKIVGGTVAWNQLVPDANIHYTTSEAVVWTDVFGFVFSLVSGHKYLISFIGKTVSGGGIGIRDSVNGVVYRPAPLTYQFIYSASTNTNQTTFLQGTWDAGTTDAYLQIHDLTAMFGSTIADYIYSLEQSQAGAGVAWFRQYFPKDYYPYDPGTLRSVEGVSAHETVGFNQWDEEWEVGTLNWTTGENAVSSTRIRSKNYIPCVPNTEYYGKIIPNVGLNIFYYDANKNFLRYRESSVSNVIFVTDSDAYYIRFAVSNDNYGTTYNHDICINLSWGGERDGEYEPYVKHTYPLDSSLTLRGVPKLVDGKLAFDGDVYLPSGEVQRRYGVVDLGTLNWDKQTLGRGSINFRAIISDFKAIPDSVVANIICDRYSPVSASVISSSTTLPPDKTIASRSSEIQGIRIYDTTYSDATADAFKSVMSGVYFVYELATPTTETADGYEQYQMCDTSGTEEFVTTGIVPVGHETRYPHDLKKKIETAPDSPSTDGTYLMKRSGGKNTYMALPSTPSANGAYVLTVTVSGGSASYSWAAKE